ncbi:cytochrome b [Alkalimonas amylolytica]|uniref:Cytochrome b561 n=1 Tax=Alkalimonas amylolytica TaxID=152573 RepID=A0A1H4FUL5_ALKAM|nr:cytochrome b [Alkalimonas amylolytica]SEB00974.1 cytochrome b561 [Alkalimonas amylolytica]
MMGKDVFTATCRRLHWLVAVGFIVVSLVGLYMANTDTWYLYPWHKSAGIVLFSIIVLRVGWRLWCGWPASVAHDRQAEQRLAKIVHWLLLIGTVLMPVTGMMYSGFSGHGFGVFGWQLVAANPDPLELGQVLPYSAYWSTLSRLGHMMAGYTMLIAIVLHIAAALKHHFVDRDPTLLRMLGR